MLRPPQSMQTSANRSISGAMRQDSVNDSLNLRVRSAEELDKEVRVLSSILFLVSSLN